MMYFFASMFLIFLLAVVSYKIIGFLWRIIKGAFRFLKKTLPVALAMVVPLVFCIVFSVLVADSALWLIPLVIIIVGYFLLFSAIYIRKKNRNSKSENNEENEDPYRQW